MTDRLTATVPLAIVLGLCALALACGPTTTPQVRSAYALETARCVANERAIVDREATTYAQDIADLATERLRCDAALAEIGGAP